jgi:hypothetical protein
MKRLSLMLFIGLLTLAGSWSSTLLWARAFSLSSPSIHQQARHCGKAFSPSTPWSASSASRRRSACSSFQRSRVFMSDIPEDNNQKRRKQQQQQRSPHPPSTNSDKDDNTRKSMNDDFGRYWTNAVSFLKPPPKPEDQLVMMGDLFSLVVYSITDHLICQSLSHYTLWQAAYDPQKLHSIADSLAASSARAAAVLATPVWLENVDGPMAYNSPAVLQVLHDQIASQLVTHYYSPLLESPGLATCLLSATWLLAGYWNRAFCFAIPCIVRHRKHSW